jgi:hypothetical protein
MSKGLKRRPIGENVVANAVENLSVSEVGADATRCLLESIGEGGVRVLLVSYELE